MTYMKSSLDSLGRTNYWENVMKKGKSHIRKSKWTTYVFMWRDFRINGKIVLIKIQECCQIAQSPQYQMVTKPGLKK